MKNVPTVWKHDDFITDAPDRFVKVFNWMQILNTNNNEYIIVIQIKIGRHPKSKINKVNWEFEWRCVEVEKKSKVWQARGESRKDKPG